MPVVPRIADIQLTRVKFEPGDRLIVRLRQPLDREAKKKLRRTIGRWAGDHVEILIVDPVLFDLEVEPFENAGKFYTPGSRRP